MTKLLGQIEWLSRWGLSMSTRDEVVLILIFCGLLLLWWLLVRQFIPWYYQKESTDSKNVTRLRRIVNLMLISIFAVSVLRTLKIDYEFLSLLLKRAPDGDESPVYFTIRISTIVTSLVAFVAANVLDLVANEFVVQRLHAAKAADNRSLSPREEEQLTRRFRAIRPLMYMLAAIVVAEATGLARYWIYRNPWDTRKEADILIDVEKILFFILVVFIIRLLLFFFTTFILQRVYNRSKVDIGSQFAINRLLTYFVYVLAGLFIVQQLGFDLVGVWTGAAALLVGIGIGLQQTFNDLICGIIILFERSVKVGDVVELTGHQVGTIRKIGTRTSILETRDDIIIFVPNSKLIGENVTNWSQVDRTARFHVTVGVAYHEDPERVREILLEVAAGHPKVLGAPRTSVRLLGFGDSSLDFDLLFWSRDLLRIEDTKSDLRFAITSAFRKEGIEIPFPQRDLWVRGGLPGMEPPAPPDSTDQTTKSTDH